MSHRPNCYVRLHLLTYTDHIQSCPGGWVDPRVGLGYGGLSWVGSGRVEILQFSMGWVGSNMTKSTIFFDD